MTRTGRRRVAAPAREGHRRRPGSRRCLPRLPQPGGVGRPPRTRLRFLRE